MERLYFRAPMAQHVVDAVCYQSGISINLNRLWHVNLLLKLYLVFAFTMAVVDNAISKCRST